MWFTCLIKSYLKVRIWFMTCVWFRWCGVKDQVTVLVYLSDQGWCGGGWYLYRTVGPCPRGTLFVSWHHSTFCDMILNKKEFVCKCITLKTSSKFTKKSVKHKYSLMVQVWRRLALQYKHFVISWEIEKEMLSGCGLITNMYK